MNIVVKCLLPIVGAVVAIFASLYYVGDNTVLKVILIVLFVIAAILADLYMLGTYLQEKTQSGQAVMEANKMTLSVLVIDKKKLRLADSGLTKAVIEQVPAWLSWRKFPIAKVKIGPQVMSLIVDDKVFKELPVKTECKVVISGVYITKLVSVRK